MIRRRFWLARVAEAWRRRPLVWLSGARRTGKTTLARMLEPETYLNCDLPSVGRRLGDPESFFAGLDSSGLLVFDEVHRLEDPSAVLKIAADEHPTLRVLATGSSTLAATRKFRDSLTGRKRTVHLVPVLFEELGAFGVGDVRERLLRGGLPPVLLADGHRGEAYAEWLDSYFARDVQELFRLEKRGAFLRMVELVLRQSGGMLAVASLSKLAGVSRPTVASWLEVLQTTHVAHLLRPYAEGGRREIVAQPKIYGFDTGFVCFARGWDSLRAEDCGLLWEHLVLETLLSIPLERLHFWRDKQQREVDFVVPRGRQAVDAIECKWSADSFDPRGMAAFRERYPAGRNLVVSPHVTESYRRRLGALAVDFVPLPSLRKRLG